MYFLYQELQLWHMYYLVSLASTDQQELPGNIVGLREKEKAPLQAYPRNVIRSKDSAPCLWQHRLNARSRGLHTFAIAHGWNQKGDKECTATRDLWMGLCEGAQKPCTVCWRAISTKSNISAEWFGIKSHRVHSSAVNCLGLCSTFSGLCGHLVAVGIRRW